MGRGCVSGRKKQFRNFEFQFSGEFLNLFIFRLFPENSEFEFLHFRLQFLFFGEFVYFSTFPGKIQNFYISDFQFFLANLFICRLCRKIQNYYFSGFFKIFLLVIPGISGSSRCL